MIWKYIFFNQQKFVTNNVIFWENAFRILKKRKIWIFTDVLDEFLENVWIGNVLI